VTVGSRASYGAVGPGAQQGVALVIVLWLIVVLSVMAAGHARNSHVETALAGRYVETTSARFVAEAVTQMAIAELLSTRAEELPVDGRLRAVTVDTRQAVVSVRRATGLVDLNTANETLLRAVFIAAGADESDAEALAARVLDWRDGDEFTHLHGAEDADYRAIGLPWSARDAAFSSIEELRYVLGMSAALYKAVSPYLTVHSQRSGIEIEIAPPFLIAALDADNAGGTQRRMRAVARGGNGVFHINVGVPGQRGVFVSVEAIVAIERNAEQPFRVLAWRDVSRLLTEKRAEPAI